MYQNTKYNEHLNVSGNKIKELRMKNKLTLSALSIKLALIGIDIPKQSLYKLETGDRVIKDFELCGFAHIFKVPMENLLEDFISEINKEEIV